MGRVSFMEPLYGNLEITSHYGMRDDPNNPGTIKKHNGIDCKAAIGDKVRASASGLVVGAWEHGGLGNLIIIDHAPLAEKGGRKIFTLYGHLKEMDVEFGEFVLKGEDIGLSGETGSFAKGPHLHFGVFDSKYATDELNWNTVKNTGVEGHNASDPDDYIGHGYELDGTILDINDLQEKTFAKVYRVMEVDTTVNKRDGAWRSNVVVDNKNKGYMDRRNLELELDFTLQEAIAFLRKPMKERKTDEYIV